MKLIIEQLGGMCPTQGWGTLDGEQFYFRYRHDDAQLEVGPGDPENVEMPIVRLYAEIRDVTGDENRGWLEEDEAVALIKRMIPMLRPVGEWEGGTYQDRLIAAVDALVEAHKKNKEMNHNIE